MNQLAAVLDTYWPGGKEVFATLHSAIALNFLSRYPSPQSAAKITVAKMAAFCTKNGYSGRRTAVELLGRMHTAPTVATSVNHEVIGALVTAQVAVIKAMQTAISDLDTVIAEKVALHPYAHLLADLPRIGVLNLGQIIGEVGPILERATSFDQLAAETGIAPSPARREKAMSSASDTPPTAARARACTPGAATVATRIPGQSDATRMPAAAGNATRTHCEHSDEPGYGSSGPAGKPRPPTIPSCTRPEMS